MDSFFHQMLLRFYSTVEWQCYRGEIKVTINQTQLQTFPDKILLYKFEAHQKYPLPYWIHQLLTYCRGSKYRITYWCMVRFIKIGIWNIFKREYLSLSLLVWKPLFFLIKTVKSSSEQIFFLPKIIPQTFMEFQDL